ncbi:thrombospondin type-1 domain-containing protein 7A-like [Rhopilema esculentum]|uniref:thrombospondin type-1 domain-containing protein 7A-like n=1 Tax=Rhopilema esculentum TaxID=499914 RepID=UPI0031D2ACA3
MGINRTTFSIDIFIKSLIILSWLCIIHSYTGKQSESQKDFTWKPEAWRSCHKGKSCEDPGIRRRSLACVNRKGEKTSHKNCDRKTRPRRRESCVAVACKNHTSFKLEIFPWKSCNSEPLLNYDLPNLMSKNSTIEIRNTINQSVQDYIYMGHESNWKRSLIGSCGSLENAVIYVKRRNVSCYAHWPRKNIRIKTKVEDCLNHSRNKPKTIQLCSFGCKQKCSVSLWSKWEVSPLLPPDQKFRRRQITYYPYFDDNLEVCAGLIEFGSGEQPAIWEGKRIQPEVSAWSKCEKNNTGTDNSNSPFPVVGIRTRKVSCVASNGMRVRCNKTESGQIPAYQACILSRDCRVTQWSRWSSCYAVFSKKIGIEREGSNAVFYQRHRIRYIVVTQLPKGKVCPRLKEQKRCELSGSSVLETKYRNASFANNSYQWFAGEFGSCQPDKKDCRSGIKTRSVFCIRQGDAKFNPVGSQFCAHLNKPEGKVFCRNPCKETCALGEWNSWSGCMADCRGDVTGTVRGTHYRVRRVIQYSGDPRSCEDYAESRPCTLTNCVSWVAGTQTICLLDDIHRACGNGKTHRAVYCMNAKGQQVDESLCQEDRPSRSLPCHVPCSDDCVVGIWSEWGPCEGECGKNGTQGESYRIRKRSVLAYPGWSGRPCPDGKDMIEQQSCLGENCGTYRWTVDEWSVCTVKQARFGTRIIKDSKKRLCMIGKRSRNVTCIDNAGGKVRDYLCSIFLKPQEEKECRLCIEDCVLSPWSEWSSCPTECGQGQNKVQPFRKRERFIIREGQGGGKLCPNVEALTQVEKCRSCDDYHWYLDGWSHCITAPADDCIGMRTRRVFCKKRSSSKVEPDGFCLLKGRKPREISTCAKNCGNRCILPEWSRWGGCNKECGTGYSRRTRNVFGNSISCDPNMTLSEERRCNTHPCGQYSLRSGAWSRCYSKDIKRGCGAGQQWRNITCFKISGPQVPLQYCIEELYGGKMTLNFERECDVTCPFDCKLSSWSAYTPCSRKCGSGVKTRFRTIVQEATHGGQMCAVANGEKQISETVPCLERQCFNFVWKADPWETCQITNQTRSRVTQCGTGFHTRKVYCTDSRFSGRRARVNDSFCDAKEKPATKDSCLMYCPGDCVVGQWTSWSRSQRNALTRECDVTCPFDCKLSSWSAYTPCSRKCGSGVKTRFRTIVQEATHGGQMCAVANGEKQISETVPCLERQCFNFVWKADPWETCQITNQTRSRVTQCGTGFHTRKVYCTDSRFSGRRARVNDSFCDAKEKPATKDSCLMYCPGDCVVGQWTSWSRCSSTCPRPGHRRRERTVLRYPAHDGKNCPVLERYEPCNLKNCYTHLWRTTQWSSCIFYTDDASCGVGTQRRMADCVRSDGKIVHSFYCRVEGRRVPILLRMCTVPCPRNCELSEWGIWSSCPEECNGMAVQRRTRFTLAQAEHEGQSCLESDSLQEFRSCPMKPCFTVHVGEWGDCIPNGDNNCGYGTMKREVSCTRDDGRLVDDSNCLQLTTGSIPKEDICRIPCNGDCVTAQWSGWSSCFGLCTVKNESIFSYGVQIRTRHILRQPTEYGIRCPRDLVLREKCDKPLCFTFSWKTGPYIGKKRDVWCERSDGLNVSNGCDLAYKPSTTQLCQPKCQVTHSFCNSKKICVCKKHYIPILSSHGHLIHCLSDSNTFRNRTKDNDVTTNKSSSGGKDSSWFGDLPIIIWIVIGVCFVYFLLFLAIVIVYTRRRKSGPRVRRASTADVGTLTNPERIPLTEHKTGHHRTDSKMSFATSSGRGSTMSAISDHDDGEQWPQPPETVVVSEFIRQHLKNFNKSSFCSTLSDESLQDKSQAYGLSRGTSFDATGTYKSF